MEIITPKDPLSILREDTFSNEETNEMVGKMIRRQYIKEQEPENLVSNGNSNQ